MLLSLYKSLMRVSSPLLRLYLQKRLGQGKEDAARLAERLGVAGIPRPDGGLVWCHAASVGEALSMLEPVRQILAAFPDAHVLMTSGTVTSARLLQERLPARAFHQYMPVDHPAWVARFLDQWRPDAVVWAESEFWPNMLSAVVERRIPAVLLNARMSERSFRRWRRFPAAVAHVLSAFNVCFAQNASEAGRLRLCGARDVRVSGNMKYAAEPLPDDAEKRRDLEEKIGRRPAVLWASTHPGEEDMAEALHRKMVAQVKDFLTVIVPRHPARGEEICQSLRAGGWRVARRAAGENISGDTNIYLADTLGELGVFYRLCPHVVMGGSFADIGGHNPIEPAQLGCVVMCGPYMQNFRFVLDDFMQAGAIIQVQDMASLAEKVADIVADPQRFASVAQAARRLTADKSGVVNGMMHDILPLIRESLHGAETGRT